MGDRRLISNSISAAMSPPSLKQAATPLIRPTSSSYDSRPAAPLDGVVVVVLHLERLDRLRRVVLHALEDDAAAAGRQDYSRARAFGSLVTRFRTGGELHIE